ncbi:MAG: putative membrane protein [Arcticibacterium sp.]|jgi:uncharacterized membrane protein
MPTRILVVLILIIAGLLRFFTIGSYGPYTDEKFTLLNVHGICVGGYNSPELTDNETFTPKDFWKERNLEDHFQAIARSDFGTHFTYNVILKYWIKAFGLNDAMVRTLSVLFNLITLILVYWFCKTFLESKKIGLWAIGLLAIDPLFISQSHYARSYTLSFLLVFLGSIIFYKILTSKNKDKIWKLGLFYGLLASLALLNHYLNFIIFLGHVLVAVLYIRDHRKWVSLVAAGTFTLLVMGYWMTMGGGQWSMEFLKDKNALHLSLAEMPVEQNPMSGIVDPSTLQFVTQKASSIFLKSSAASFDLYHSLRGIRQIIILFGTTLVFFLAYRFLKPHQEKVRLAFFAILLVLGIIMLPGVFKLSFIAGAFVLLLAYQFHKSEIYSPLKALLVFSAVLPLLYVIFDAFKSGHTTSLSPRYIGVCIPFLAIIYAIGLTKTSQEKSTFKFLLIVPILFQLFITGKELKLIFEDRSEAYSFRVEPRVKNPFQRAAELVKANYEEGDTLFIPSYGTNVYSDIRKDNIKGIKNISDAQYLNLYLPKDALYVEKIDVNEPDLLIIQKASGERLELFDFKGSKLRY